ncbi:MAG: universal stress protein [Caldilineales bacterium]|nr:universal stress protein [Caldilineales bacterium]MDW8316338.1 universal stress protein [Anaerolineae bacterium]
MYKRILVPLDGSTFAERALPHALEIARATNGELHLLTVVPLLDNQSMAVVDLYPMYVYRSFTVDQSQEMERLQADLRAYLEELCRRAASGGVRAEPVVRSGQPAEEIISYAHEAGCDLIVMSTHGRSGIGRWVYGSVADKVLRGADVPVLLVRARAEE